jgi:hypothetical protein
VAATGLSLGRPAFEVVPTSGGAEASGGPLTPGDGGLGGKGKEATPKSYKKFPSWAIEILPICIKSYHYEKLA